MGFLASLHSTVTPHLPAVVNKVLAGGDRAIAGFGAPQGTALLLLLVATLLLARAVASKLLGGGSSSAKRTGDTVLLFGTSGSGKTALFHTLCFGTSPATVTSQEEAVVKTALFDADGDADEAGAAKKPEYTFVDYPGHQRLRGRALYAHAKRARSVVFMVDSSATSDKSIQQAAEYLYDLFTNEDFVEQMPDLLIACNKADLAAALAPKALQAKLEAALDVLKKTRSSLGTTDEDDSSLRLGRKGQPFNFQTDAPCEVEFCACSVKDGNVDAVRRFIEESFAG